MVRYLRAANVKAGALDLTDVKEMNFGPTEQDVFALRRGDMLVTEGAGSLNAVGASTVWNEELDGIVCIQNTLVRLRPRTDVTYPRYLFWWAQHAYASQTFASIAGGVNIFHLGSERVGDLPADLPSLAAQREIADFLDAETARIDALLAMRGSQLPLLVERQSSIINSTLTGEITTDAQGVPTGCVGTPSVRLANLARVQGGLTLDGGRELDQNAIELPYLRVANVQDGRLDLDEVKTVRVPQNLAANCSLQAGDVLMTEGGDPDKLGRGTVWPGHIRPCLHQNHVFAVRPDQTRVDPSYLALISRTQYARVYFEMTAAKTTGIASTSASKISAFRVPLPDLNAQRSQVTEVGRRLAEVDAISLAVTRQIALVNERRQALITAAVTGAINVSTVTGRGVPE